MESQAAIETIPEVDEREKALEDTIKIMDDEKRKEEESKHFWYDKSPQIPLDRDPLHFNRLYKELITNLIMCRFDF